MIMKGDARVCDGGGTAFDVDEYIAELYLHSSSNKCPQYSNSSHLAKDHFYTPPDLKGG